MTNYEIQYFKRFVTVMLLCFSLISFSQTLVPSDNATNISNDMVFKMTFNAAPVLQSSGKISLYTTNGTLIQTIDLSTMPSGTPMNATWPWSETLNGTTIKVVPVTIDGNSVYIRFYNGKMTYNTEYYVTVDKAVFSNASSLGFNGIAANNWSFTTRSQPAADLNYTVSADGTGDFATLQGALDFLPTGTTNAKIFMKNGVYVGLAFIKSKNSFTIEGESKTGVIIKGFNNNNLNPSTHWRSVVNLQGNDINIINVTFRNTTPNGGTQAEVLKLNGLRCVIVNCLFYSYQDTVLIEGKVYFKDCMLEGDVDFIWGVGTVFFQSCELRANDNGGYNVMARNDNTKHGYAFADCKLTRTSTATATQYLGRDANTSYPYAEIVYLNCTMGSQIPAVGWNIRTEMTGTGIFFAEYKSVNESGTLINTSSRHSLSKQLTDAQNTLYRDLNWFFNGWIPVVPDVQPKPVVAITAPVNNASFQAGSTIILTATAIVSSGTISKVEFYNGTTLIGAGTASGTTYTYSWTNVAAGTFTITAVATDSFGSKTTSSGVLVVVLGKDCAGISGGSAYLDKCGTCVSGTTGLTPCAPVKLQAEDACQFDGTIDSNNPGFEGTGFVNSPNAVGAKITVYIYASSAIQVLFDVVYANGGTTDRSAQILLNGTQINANFLLPPTGAWTTYSPANVNIQLVQGVNKIEFIAITDGGLPNMDYFGIYGDAIFSGCQQTQTVPLSQGWNLISINVVPNDNTISTLFNGLDVQTIKTMNSFWYKDQPAYLNTLTTIETGEGYLVYMNAAGILSIEGVTLSHTLNVVQKNGWQLIGCPYQTATPFSTDFNATNCDIIKNFEGFWQPNGTMNSIQNMEPGKGYFVK